jgi:hypothetical protein
MGRLVDQRGCRSIGFGILLVLIETADAAERALLPQISIAPPKLPNPTIR